MKQSSHYLSFLLRHKPEEKNLSLKADGWCNIADLEPLFTRSDLEQIIKNDRKGRFEMNKDGTEIRATYGHSVPIVWTQPPSKPPKILYHGTAERPQTGD